MPTEREDRFKTGTIYFNGDYEHGIVVKDGIVTTVEEDNEVRPCTDLRSSGAYGYLIDRDLTKGYAISKIEAYEFAYFCINFVMDQCPNRRVAYLARRGKNRRVIMKNFRRAVKLVEEKFKRIGKER